ncbi:hypothetical protein ZWY2020_014947 [Hordeum vulgare]|nr:hypothetical protein ZWY2020_014947 [Hordeum vulgare]
MMENELKTKECQEAQTSLGDLQMELMRKSMHVGSLTAVPAPSRVCMRAPRKVHFGPQLPPSPATAGSVLQSEATKPSMAVAAAEIASSMLSSDFANLASEAESMVRLGAD